ncbi:MAG: serine/threonine protein kinase [Elusimicrobia bacterium]|nr:serine/threonine protein kinase [Elusimicrobiota bacterium]
MTRFPIAALLSAACLAFCAPRAFSEKLVDQEPRELRADDDEAVAAPRHALARYQEGQGAETGKAGAAVAVPGLLDRAPFWAVLGGTVVAAMLAGLALVWAVGSRIGRLAAAPAGSAGGAAARKGERYQVEEAPFARGGMGTVHEGHDRHLGRKVAVKRLHPALLADARERERFRHEARALAKLNHPNVVALYDFVDHGERLEIIFEYVQGKTVGQLMEERAGRRLEPAAAARVVEAACEALGYAHAEGIIHRDIKPSNLMVTDAGVVKVMDFGISRSVKDTLGTMTNTPCGTPFYMAPEQEQGVVRRESDLYSVGVTAYEMLTGRLPFEGPAELQLKRSGKFSEAWVPPPLAPFFARALDPEPSKRWTSARELREAFATALSGTPRRA